MGNAVLRRIYLSPLGYLAHLAMAAVSPFRRHMMVYGYRDRVSGKFRRNTRIGNSTFVSAPKTTAIGDNVWIGQQCSLEGSNGIDIGEGCQIADGTRIFTHGSHHAIRILGSRYIETAHDDRAGYTRRSVRLGEYTFVGVNCVLLPGTKLGRGCLVAAGSVVSGEHPEFSYLRGNPAKRVGDTRAVDAEHPLDDHFAPDAVRAWQSRSHHKMPTHAPAVLT